MFSSGSSQNARQTKICRSVESSGALLQARLMSATISGRSGVRPGSAGARISEGSLDLVTYAESHRHATWRNRSAAEYENWSVATESRLDGGDDLRRPLIAVGDGVRHTVELDLG